MAETRTETIAVRVPLAVRKALAAEAAALDQTPGQFLRAIVEGRYKPRKEAGDTLVSPATQHQTLEV